MSTDPSFFDERKEWSERKHIYSEQVSQDGFDDVREMSIILTLLRAVAGTAVHQGSTFQAHLYVPQS